MREDIATILFHNSSLLVKTPAPQTDIVCSGTDGRKKLGPKTYSFGARFPTANVTVGNLFVVSTEASSVCFVLSHLRRSLQDECALLPTGVSCLSGLIDCSCCTGSGQQQHDCPDP